MHTKAAIATLTSLFPSLVLAQDLPDTKSIRELIANNVPGYWDLGEITVVATSRGGDVAKPTALMRFEAEATNREPLFALASEEGPYALVVPTHDSEQVRTLYGVADLSYFAGSWAGGVTIENPVDALGHPVDLFVKPVLILGSEEAQVRLAALRDQSIGALVSQQEAEVQTMTNRHAARVSELKQAQENELKMLSAEQARKVTDMLAANAGELSENLAAHSKAVSDMKAAHAIQLAELTAAKNKDVLRLQAQEEKRISELEKKYSLQLAELTSANEPVIAAAKAEREKALAIEAEKTAAALREAREAGTKELETLRAEHARRRGELIEKQTAELAEIETRLSIERRSLERQLETANDVIALQTQLASTLETRQASADQLLAAYETEKESRIAFFARLNQTWSGTARCSEKGGKGRSWDNTAGLRLRTALGNGFEGELWEERGNHDVFVSASLMQDSPSIPMQLRLVSNDPLRWSRAKSLDMTLSADGRMTLTSDVTWSVDNVTTPVTCTWMLSPAAE